MTARIMKKCLIICAICFLMPLLFCLTSCVNDMYRKRMLDYYEDDSNYVELTGIVIENDNDNAPKIKIISALNEFYLYNSDVAYFACYADFSIFDNINVGDKIIFKSADRVFFNGYILPIVSIIKDDQELLSFEEGKEGLLYWIKEVFK